MHMHELQATIDDWAKATFPQQTPRRLLNHLRDEEVDELDAALDASDPREIRDSIADCCILLFQLASEYGIDVGAAISEKHIANTKRRFAYDPRHGYDKHVPEATTGSGNEQALPTAAELPSDPFAARPFYDQASRLLDEYRARNGRLVEEIEKMRAETERKLDDAEKALRGRDEEIAALRADREQMSAHHSSFANGIAFALREMRGSE